MIRYTYTYKESAEQEDWFTDTIEDNRSWEYVKADIQSKDAERIIGTYTSERIEDSSTNNGFNSSTGENVNDTKNSPQTPEDVEKQTTQLEIIKVPGGLSTSEEVVTIEDVVNSFNSYAAWDPRLFRHDEYFVVGNNNGTRVPFSSDSAISAFADYSDVIEVGVLQKQIQANKKMADTPLGRVVNSLKTGSTTKIIANDTKVFKNDPNFYGVQSIVNPYTITKLCGGLELSGGNVNNYMYDIRDQRRFYDVHGNESNDVISISNPTVTELINWSNNDLWGRTPYSFQDFVYCKYFGLIPNNRLITLRRYAVPTFDNLQFENMTTNDHNTENAGKQGNPNNKTFSPIAYVVTWFGGETGNSLSNLMSFTTGLQWEDVTSQVWDVNGEDGETKQAVIDKMLGDGASHTDAFGTAEYTPLNSLFSGASWVSSKIASFGKFALALKNEEGFGESQDTYEHRIGAQVDPFDTTFLNKTKGPLNAIMSVKKRKQGIEFSHSITIKCTYQAKAIGGINPKAALLDVLGNCMEIVSPHAVFWGGGHRFMVKPQLYPFSDGGWRDSFMARIYDGNFLGPNGAIATVLSGLKSVGNNNNGQFDFSIVKNIFGNAAGFIGGAIQSLSNILNQNGVGFLDGMASSLFNFGSAAIGQDMSVHGANMATNLLNNLSNLWHNRMFVATTQPKITATGNILIGEPTGEWHLTVGNPLNPIMVIGNLICKDMKVKFSDEIGPDDFPTEFEVDYTLEHAMARDSDAIQSMFNRGMGKFYTLPDYVSTSSDYNTAVDKYTKDDYVAGVTGDFGYIQGGNTEFAGVRQNKYHITPGSEPVMHGNYSTQLITKFNPLNIQAERSVKELKSAKQQALMPNIRSLAAIRKLTTV